MINKMFISTRTRFLLCVVFFTIVSVSLLGQTLNCDALLQQRSPVTLTMEKDYLSCLVQLEQSYNSNKQTLASDKIGNCENEINRLNKKITKDIKGCRRLKGKELADKQAHISQDSTYLLTKKNELEQLGLLKSKLKEQREQILFIYDKLIVFYGSNDSEVNKLKMIEKKEKLVSGK